MRSAPSSHLLPSLFAFCILEAAQTSYYINYMSTMSGNSPEHVVIEMTDIIGSDHTNTSSLASSDHNIGPTPTQNKPPFVAFTNSAAKSREERDVEFDEDMLRRAIADTGKWAYGTISVEAWVLDEETGKLVRPHRAVSCLQLYYSLK